MPFTAGQILRLKVSALLQSQGRTQKDLALYLGKTPAWATDFLKGRHGVVLADLDRLARFFGVSVPQLFEIDGHRLRPEPERRRNERRSGRDRRNTERRLTEF